MIQSSINITKLKSQIVKLKRQLLQEKTENKAWNVRNAELQQNIINLGTNPIETKPVADLIKEKDNEIKSFKKKLQMPVSQHLDSPELVALQEERDKVYKEMLINFQGAGD